RKSNEDVTIIELTYDKNNVATQKINMDGYSTLITYTYDTYKNPFKDALFGSEEMMLSENNILSVLYTATFIDEKIEMKYDYSYVYDKKYPTKVEVKMSIEMFGEEFTETETIYYEYLK
ncbi:MAG: hypothetical protein GX330_01220, partial [Bacteroidales bacterium]|nr:hypothetical protein [Bacteroidales bacterium]